MSQAIIRAYTDKIYLYNKSDTEYYADSIASEYMFPDKSILKTYRHISNLYDTLGHTTKIPNEVTGTAIYTLNGKTILTQNALHIHALRGPLYSIHKHCQQPGFGIYSSYKYGLYLFHPDFISKVEYSYEKIVSYRPLGLSHQRTIDYIEPKSIWSTNIATPSGRPLTIAPADNPQ